MNIDEIVWNFPKMTLNDRKCGFDRDKSENGIKWTFFMSILWWKKYSINHVYLAKWNLRRAEFPWWCDGWCCPWGRCNLHALACQLYLVRGWEGEVERYPWCVRTTLRILSTEDLQLSLYPNSAGSPGDPQSVTGSKEVNLRPGTMA